MGKLVRDKIPDIIRADGMEPIVRKLPFGEYVTALGQKAIEEGVELSDAVTPDEMMEELADIVDVVHATLRAIGRTSEELEAVRAAKNAERGGFEQQYYWEGNR